MSILNRLVESGALTPLSCHFARFIARQSGQAEESLLVLTAALLSQSNQQGDVCLDLGRRAGMSLFVSAMVPVGLSSAAAETAAPPLAQWQAALLQSHCVGKPGELAPLILDGSRLYLQRFWSDEQTVYHAINARLQFVEDIDLARLQLGLARLYPQRATPARPGIHPQLDLLASVAAAEPDWQCVASALAVTRRFAVISGGPGTGKTTTVVKVLVLLLEQNPALRLRLAAPTGKAAARMVESIRAARGRLNLSPEIAALLPDEASTLHRLLGYQGNGARGGFRHNRLNPLLVDCLVIDEASMIDLTLMKALLDATPANTRVILLGDRDQLASVDAGNVLGDITGHGRELTYTPAMAALLARLTCIEQNCLLQEEGGPAVADAIALLRTSHRFSADSAIGRLATLVNKGDDAAALALLVQGQDARVDNTWQGDSEVVLLQPAANEWNPLNRAVLDWAVQRYSAYLRCQSVEEALQSFEATRILCASHEGPCGDMEINRLLAERLRARGLLESGEDFHGKPVMITVNDYELGLFNGDIGLLWRDEDGILQACFAQLDGQVRRLPARSLPEHVTAWALTVHKSQGSEFDQVMLVLPADINSPLLLRELLYTGITRARRRLLIHSAPEVFAAACRTPVQRSSGLAGLLGWR
ncbi:MAG: exodeoxyribonuclease V subunit alpha [Gammaproteobacteria bacterium]|nr:exodeoxyribonuclease V subunit alpha [Gammaproteobacteria bacterium]